MLFKKLSLNKNIKTEPSNFSDWLVQQRSEFFIYSESGLTFKSWFQGCEGIFRIDQADVPEHRRYFIQRNSSYPIEIIW